MRNKRNAMIAAVVAAIIMVVSGWLLLRNIGDPALPLNTLAPAGRQGWEIFGLVKWVFGVAGLVFVLVEAGLIWMAIRFKRNKSDVDGVGEPTQTHGNTPLEIGWTVLPALVLATLAVFNVQTLLRAEESNNPIEVRAVGQQWWWSTATTSTATAPSTSSPPRRWSCPWVATSR